MPLRFEYDERGFRIKANFNESGDVDVTYDSVGGLTSVSYPKDGGRATEEYVVGENNELIEVKAEGKTGVRVEYDSVGRAINITRGSKIFTIQYDQPGRVTSVTLNGSPFLKRSYDTMDVDAVVSSDQRTSYITIPQPMVSSIFGSIDEIVYTRRRGAVYGPVRFDAKLSGFVLHASPVPDQSTLASFEKRMLTPLGRDFLPAPFLFDKPTNSLFVPPEYVSVNCMTCTASIGSTTLGLSTPLWAGTSGTLTGSTAGTCNFYGSDVPWTHLFTTGDGGSMSVMGNTASGNHTWNPAGDYMTSDSPQCACTDPFFIPTSVYLVAAVGSAPCPTQSAPEFSTAPSPTYPKKINGGIDWGETKFAWTTSGLSCSEVCSGKFRIQGDIVSTGNSHVKVSTVIHKEGACVDAPRFTTRKNQTLAHENIHVTKYWTKFNSFKSQIVGDHQSLKACNTAKTKLQGAVTTAMNEEATKQGAHLDHAGQYKFTWYCPSAGAPTQELRCGAPNTSCSSNTY